MKWIITLIALLSALSIKAQYVLPFTQEQCKRMPINNAKSMSYSSDELRPPIVCMRKEGEKLEVNRSFTNAIVKDFQIEGKQYSRLTIAGYGVETELGCPMLPGYSDIVVTEDEQVTCDVSSSDYVEYTGVDIIPAQEAEQDSEYKSDSSFYIDKRFYSQNRFFPEDIVHIQSIQKYKGKPVVLVRVNPVQYNPVTHTIRCYSNIEYSIIGAKGIVSSMRQLDQLVFYNDTITTHYSVNPEKYIIVTTDKYVNTLSDFISRKERLGYKVSLLTRNGNWTSTSEVKNAILSNCSLYDHTNPKYLLIVGNHQEVPAVQKHVWAKTPDGSWQEQDVYYTDHDYSVLSNDTITFLPSMARGRFYVSSIEELEAVLEKLADYEVYQTWSNRVSLCAQFESKKNKGGYVFPTIEGKRWIKTSEEIRDYLLNNSFYNNVNRLYKKDTGTTPVFYNDSLYAFGDSIPMGIDWETTSNDLIYNLDLGTDLIIYRGHGSNSGWNTHHLDTLLVNSLDNSKQPIVLSITCDTGAFLNGSSPQGFLAGKLLSIENGGAIGIVAATVQSVPGYADVLTEGMINAMFPRPGISPLLPSHVNVMIDENGYIYTPYATSDTISVYPVSCMMNEGFFKLLQTYGYIDSSYPERKENIRTILSYQFFGDPTTEIYSGPTEDLSSVDIQKVNGCVIVNTNGISDCTIILKPIPPTSTLDFQMAEHVNGVFAFEPSFGKYSIVVRKHNCRPVFYETDDDAVYLQDKTETGTVIYQGGDIHAGHSVTTAIPEGDYIIDQGADVEIQARHSVVLDRGFSVKQGATFKINMQP